MKWERHYIGTTSSVSGFMDMETEDNNQRSDGTDGKQYNVDSEIRGRDDKNEVKEKTKAAGDGKSIDAEPDKKRRI